MLILRGVQFGRLTVLDDSLYKYSGRKKRSALCKCQCGKTLVTTIELLRQMKTTSCGCVHTEGLKKIHREINTKHGEFSNGKAGSPEYYSWNNLKCRCNNPKDKDYSKYGGRGIKVCKRWIKSFSNFLSDMGRKPGPEYSIDRINVDGNYEPSNCRWATPSQQVHNRRVPC